MIHHVFANKSNIGDWLSARGIQSLLAPAGVEEHLCDEPFIDDTLAALSRATERDLIVIGGGGLLMDYFVPFWDGLHAIADRVPFGLWGVGVCDLKAEPSLPPLERLAELASRARFCVLRDRLTHDLLAGCTSHQPVPCPSLCSIAPPGAAGRGLLHVDNLTTVGAPAYERMDDRGRAFAVATGRPFLRTNNRIEPGSGLELERALALYRRADVVLSSALHGCVIAVAMGRRVIAVSGDRKIDSFMAAAGLAEWTLDADAVDEIDILLERIEEQPGREAFAAAARAANEDVAREVASVATERR